MICDQGNISLASITDGTSNTMTIPKTGTGSSVGDIAIDDDYWNDGDPGINLSTRLASHRT